MQLSLTQLIFLFLVMLAVSAFVISFVIRLLMFSSTESAVKRLDQEIAKATAKQAELGRKLHEADEELQKRKAEAKELADKLRAEAEQETKAERDKIIGEARKEGEEIIAKAHIACEKMEKELNRDFGMHIAKCSVDILCDVMSQKAKDALERILIDEFLERIKTIDVAQVGSDVTEVELLSLKPVAKDVEEKIKSALKERLGKAVSLKTSSAEGLGGGVILKFDTMALDGSLREVIRVAAVQKQEKLATQII